MSVNQFFMNQSNFNDYKLSQFHFNQSYLKPICCILLSFLDQLYPYRLTGTSFRSSFIFCLLKNTSMTISPDMSEYLQSIMTVLDIIINSVNMSAAPNIGKHRLEIGLLRIYIWYENK